jgi:hypothetical protein
LISDFQSAETIFGGGMGRKGSHGGLDRIERSYKHATKIKPFWMDITIFNESKKFVCGPL